MRGSTHTFAPSPAETSLTLQPRRAYTVTELIVVGGILVVLLALLLPPATRVGPSVGRRTACKNNLKQIGLALHNYRDQYGTFPPVFSRNEQGEPSHSWRTFVLPLLPDTSALQQQIDLARSWDESANSDVAKLVPSAYRCPSAWRTAQTEQTKELTTYLALVNHDGTMGIRFKPPKDFETASDAIQVIDVTERDAVPWMSPRDVTIEQLGQLSWNDRDGHTGVILALFGDGSVRFIDRSTWPWELADKPTSAVGAASAGTTSPTAPH